MASIRTRKTSSGSRDSMNWRIKTALLPYIPPPCMGGGMWGFGHKSAGRRPWGPGEVDVAAAAVTPAAATRVGGEGEGAIQEEGGGAGGGGGGGGGAGGGGGGAAPSGAADSSPKGASRARRKGRLLRTTLLSSTRCWTTSGPSFRSMLPESTRRACPEAAL